MTDLSTAIEERRTRIAELTAEVEQLERAADLVRGVLSGVKPPPRAKKERAVRAEPKPVAVKRNGDTYAKCGHPRTRENSYIPTKNGVEGSWSCKTCQAAAYQRRKVAAKSGKAPKTKAEPDPVPAPVTPPRLSSREAEKVEKLERRSRVIAEVRASVLVVTEKPEGKVLSPEERERLSAAIRWKKQCSALNDRGQRCALLHPHEGVLHNASGRPFSVALPAGSALPRRELDERAVSGAP